MNLVMIKDSFLYFNEIIQKYNKNVIFTLFRDFK